MAKQPRGRHGIRQGQRQVQIDFPGDVTPEMITEVVTAFECMLQCLWKYVIQKHDGKRVAQSPARRKRRPA